MLYQVRVLGSYAINFWNDEKAYELMEGHFEMLPLVDGDKGTETITHTNFNNRNLLMAVRCRDYARTISSVCPGVGDN